MAAKGEADEVPVVPAERDTSDGAAGEEAPERDRSADDVCTKFVVCIVNYSCLVILITVGISFTVGIWTLSEVYEQGAERTFALIEGGPNDRNDLRTLSFEGVRQAQQLNAVKWRMKANDVEDATDPGQILCGEIRRQYRENREGRRLQEGTPAHNDGGGEDGSLLERLDELFSGSGHLPGQTPPVGPLTPEWEALVADRVRQLEPRSRRLQQNQGERDRLEASFLTFLTTKLCWKGVCSVFDWGSGVNLRTYESTVNDDVWGSRGDPWLPSVSHENHANEIRYCYKEAFFTEIDGFDRREQFVMRWRGNITADVDGLYQFMTESDDGSYLYVDGQRVVENGGFHGHETKIGGKHLTAGRHSITISFFESGGGAGLTAGMKAPDSDWQPISGQGFRFEAYDCGPPASATNSSDLDFSGCDPFATQQAKGATLGATGPGCNALCDPESSGCSATQSKEKDVFVNVFEAVAGPNPYYATKDPAKFGGEYDKYGDGPGDLFTDANLAEVKRLEDVMIANEEACIAKDADDSGAVLQCAAADISGGFAASMASCIGREVTLDEGFDLSTLNSASENCRYNPGYKAFCRIDQTAGGTGKCRKIYGMMNFFYPREPPPMIEQVIQLGAVFLRDPENFQLLLSTDLGCQLQWFTHSLFEGENSFGALYALLGAIVSQMPMPASPDSPDMSAETLAAAVAFFGETGLADIYANAMCQAPSEEVCNGISGCGWSDDACAKDEASTALAQRFGELMCFGDGSGEELTGAALTQRSEDLALFFSEEHIKPYLSFFFDEGFGADNPHLKFTRGFIQFGGPIEGFRDEGEMSEVQEGALVDWFQEFVRPEFHKNWAADEPNADTGGRVEITYLLGSLLGTEIVALLVGDVLLAELSFLIVGFYMWFQTGSLWIAMFGMAEITISLPLGYWAYTYVFGIEFFDPICMLAVYIVMAIGADDVFIWFDAYKQSAYESPDISGSLETRFIWAWRKAASAMLVTSLTTCAVFFATATSPLINIKSFGIFAAIVIFLDYIYVITWLPAATVIYHKCFENTGFCRCACSARCPIQKCRRGAEREDFSCCKGKIPPKIGAALVGLLNAFPTAYLWSSYFWWLGGQGDIYSRAYIIGTVTFVMLLVGITTRVALTAYRKEEGRNTAQFFTGTVTEKLVTDERIRQGLLIAAAVVFVPMAISSLFVEPSRKPEEFLPSDHPLQKIITIMSNEFPAASWDAKVTAEIVFGVDPLLPLDRKGADDLMDYRRPLSREQRLAQGEDDWPDQPETCCGVPCSTRPCSQTVPPTCDREETCYLDSFDWAKPETQSFLLEVCDGLDDSAFVTFDRDPACYQDPCGVVRTTCVVKEMVQWLGRNCSDPAVASSEGDSCISAELLLPTYGLDRAPELSCFSTKAAEPCLLPEDKANRILWDFWDASNLEDGLIGWTDYLNPDSRVLYMTVRFPIQLKEGTFYTVGELSEPYNQIEAFVDGLEPPSSVGKPTHSTTSMSWVFMHTQSIYIEYAVLGILCAVAFAYIVLLVATNNLIIASAAVFTILCICACVLGGMVLLGWELGMTESICLTILAGFCVDYIVHFAHSYRTCTEPSRVQRATFALGHMGISVLSGALTSLGASFLLLFCTLQFFFAFGTFFFGTIMLAWCWANFFFIPLLATVGPEGSTADLFGAGGIFGGGGGGGGGGADASTDKTDDVANPVAPADEDAVD